MFLNLVYFVVELDTGYRMMDTRCRILNIEYFRNKKVLQPAYYPILNY